MKKTLFLLIACALLGVTVNAQSEVKGQKKAKKEKAKTEKVVKAAKAEPQNTVKDPVISFEKTVHDYGTIEYGANGECEFKFTNTGKEPLLLSNVRSSCGCTVPEWPKEPIMPGQTSAIKVRYNTSRVGTINKTITVTSNATEPTVTLSIRGYVNNKPEETPAQ